MAPIKREETQVEKLARELQELENDIKDIEQLIKELRAEYEQFFMGISRTPPNSKRFILDRAFRKYLGVKIQNTALNFKLQNSHSQYKILKTHWDRTLKKIEEGTYHRGIKQGKAIGITMGEKKKSAIPDQTSPDQELAKVVEEYGRLGGSGGDKKSELIDLLKKNKEQIIKKYGCDDVEFKVKKEGDKVRIKAVPKK